MQSEIISLKSKLNQKEEALAEIVDEIVYFENKLKESGLIVGATAKLINKQ